MTKPTCGCAPSKDPDQPGHSLSLISLRCVLCGYLRTQAFFMRTVKTLMRLGRCPDWSESSLGAHSFCWFCMSWLILLLSVYIALLNLMKHDLFVLFYMQYEEIITFVLLKSQFLKIMIMLIRLLVQFTTKILKIRTHEKFAVITIKFEQGLSILCLVSHRFEQGGFIIE